MVATGTRISLAGHKGTVAYEGPVDGTNGIWLGIEWDDPNRGKHDGSKDGKQYFTCRNENSGSFIRNSPNVQFGISFLDALLAKYVELPHGSQQQEKVLLGSSNGAIEVEAVNLDKIRKKFGNISKLREVSLDDEAVSSASTEGEIRKTCPNIRGLDLSLNLLSDWVTISMITRELPELSRLCLNRNRLFVIDSSALKSVPDAFPKLEEIQLNDTLIEWSQLRVVIGFMPVLRTVECGYNNMTHLDTLTSGSTPHPTIKTINLDSNRLDNWVHILNSVLAISDQMEKIVLASNFIEHIPFPEREHSSLHHLRHMSLAENPIHSWADVDSLSRWFPALESLSLSGTPLVTENELARHSRSFVVAKIPSLVTLDATAISHREREDCELFYISWVNQHGPNTEQELHQQHPQYANLLRKHSIPEKDLNTESRSQTGTRLKGNLIELQLFSAGRDSESHDKGTALMPENFNQSEAKSTSLRVLPTMTLKALRSKIFKMIKQYPNSLIRRGDEPGQCILWLKMFDKDFVKLESDRDGQDLSWIGLENGSTLFIQIY